MTVRDREVLELLREEPELLAIADAVAETERPSDLLSPGRWLAAIALAAVALFALVLAAPWDRGGGGGVLDRALAAINTQGPVTHLTTRLDVPGAERLTAESFYEPRSHLLRVVTRDDGAIVSDFTTKATEDQFTTFPGLLDAVSFYRTTLRNGQAKVVGQGTWHGRRVYWVELEQGGGLQFRVGLDRASYRPIVFRGLNPNGSPAGFQLGVLGLDYVPESTALFDTDAPVLVRGIVLGKGCRPTRARVDAFLSGSVYSKAAVASGRAGADGRFTLRVEPAKVPGAGNFRLNVQSRDKFVFQRFVRVPATEGSGWAPNRPIRVELDPGSC